MTQEKGKYRMWQLVIITILVSILAIVVDPDMAGGWGAQAIVQFAKASLANVFLYWVLRVVLHSRTHELTQVERFNRENTLVIAHGVVTGCVLLAG